MRLFTTTLLLSILLPTCTLAMSFYQSDSPADIATEEAEQAWQQGDKRLLGLMTRGMSLPGVEADNRQMAVKLCGVRKIHSTDVITSSEQLQTMREQTEYIAAYNRTMLTLCLQQDEAL